MSYRAAWGLLRDYEREFGAPLVQLQRGRGARLARRRRAAAARATRGGATPDASVAEPRRRPRRRGRRAANASRSVALLIAASHDLALAALRDVLPSAVGLDARAFVHGQPARAAAVCRGPRRRRRLSRGARRRNARDMAPFRRWLESASRPPDPLRRPRAGIDPAARQSGARTQFQGHRPQAPALRQSPDGIGDAAADRPHHARGAGCRAKRCRATRKRNSRIRRSPRRSLSGGADAGFGLRAAAAERGLAFVPLVQRALLSRGAQVATRARPAWRRCCNGCAVRRSPAWRPPFRDTTDARGNRGDGRHARRRPEPSAAPSRRAFAVAWASVFARRRHGIRVRRRSPRFAQGLQGFERRHDARRAGARPRAVRHRATGDLLGQRRDAGAGRAARSRPRRRRVVPGGRPHHPFARNRFLPC